MIGKIFDLITGYKKVGLTSVDVGRAVLVFYSPTKAFKKTVYGESLSIHEDIATIPVDHFIDKILKSSSVICDCGTVINPSKNNLKVKIAKKESFEHFYEEGYSTLFGLKDAEIFTRLLSPNTPFSH